MKLQILISTYGPNGIKRLADPANLPAIEGVGYLVSWQRGGCSDPVPAALTRADVKVVEVDSVGLGANRANCLRHATAEVCLLSDDDLIYHPQAITEAIERIDSLPQVDIFLLKSLSPDHKSYPENEYEVRRHTRPGHFVTEFEIAFRLDSVRNTGVDFNPLFGVGSGRYLAGEGTLWLSQLLRRGLKCRYLPIAVETHPGLTTSYREGTNAGVLMADGVCVAVEYPWSGVLRVPLVAWRRSGGSPSKAVSMAAALYRGYFRALLAPKSIGLWF